MRPATPGSANSGGTLMEEKEIELGDHPGREMVLDLPDSRHSRRRDLQDQDLSGRPDCTIR